MPLTCTCTSTSYSGYSLCMCILWSCTHVHVHEHALSSLSKRVRRCRAVSPQLAYTCTVEIFVFRMFRRYTTVTKIKLPTFLKHTCTCSIVNISFPPSLPPSFVPETVYSVLTSGCPADNNTGSTERWHAQVYVYGNVRVRGAGRRTL